MLQELQGKNAYLEDPQNLSQPVQAVWNHEMDRLYKAIAINDPRLPIPYTVVAMTQAEAAGLKGTENIVGRVSRTLADTLARLAPLGLGTLEQLRERYGAQRFDWKPFLGAATIESLLGQLLNQINGLLPASVQFKWEWVDFLTGNMQSAQAAVGKLTGELVLVIVDPLSLYHPAIHAWISLLDPCFERENVIIMTLTPFDLPQMQSDLHDLVRHAFSPTFDFYYDPPVPLTRRIPLCGLNLAANHEVRRLVQFRIGHHPCVVSVQDAPAYITV
jgi:hypothetical protein